MEIKIFNPQLEFIGIIDKFNSFTFKKELNEKGTFVLKVPFSIGAYSILKRNNIVSYNNLTGIIESVTADLSDAETMTINGYEITYLLSRRIIWNTIDYSGTVEGFCRKAVNDNCIACETDRIIPSLELGKLNGLPYTITKQVSYDNLFTTLKETCQLYDVGFEIVFNSKERKLIFNVFDGRQTDRVYNRDFDNIDDLSYVQSYSSFANVAKVGGKGEGENRFFAVVGNSQGLDRYEIFVDSRNSQEEGTSTADYQNILMQEGNEELAQHYEINTLDVSVMSNKDIYVGDKVSVIDKTLNIKLDTFISEIEYIYDEKSETTTITFGYNVPSIYKKVN